MKVFVLTLVVFFVSSCSSRDKVPEGVLPKNQMQEVLWDILRADEFVNSYFHKDSLHTKKDESTKLYEEVFRIHKTDKDHFEKSVHFYAAHPDILKVILDSLNNRKSGIIQDIHRRPSFDSAHKKLRPLVK